jgi:hypothetical protein
VQGGKASSTAITTESAGITDSGASSFATMSGESRTFSGCGDSEDIARRSVIKPPEMKGFVILGLDGFGKRGGGL